MKQRFILSFIRMKMISVLILLLFPSLSLANSYRCKTIDGRRSLPFREVNLRWVSGDNLADDLELKFIRGGETKLHRGFFMKQTENGEQVYTGFDDLSQGGDYLDISIFTETVNETMRYFYLILDGFAYELDRKDERAIEFSCEKLI